MPTLPTEIMTTYKPSDITNFIIGRDYIRVYKGAKYDKWMRSPHRWELTVSDKQIIIPSRDGLTIAKFEYYYAKHDPTPRVLVFGSYFQPEADYELICGINLNYLSEGMEYYLLQRVWKITEVGDDLKERVKQVRTFMPDLFRLGYRTYKEQFISVISIELVH